MWPPLGGHFFAFAGIHKYFFAFQIQFRQQGVRVNILNIKSNSHATQNFKTRYLLPCRLTADNFLQKRSNHSN